MTAPPRIAAPCGSWPSPITVDLVTRESLRLEQPAVDGERVWWVETRRSEGGRSVLMSTRPGAAPEEMTPPEFSVRSRVHEYGGGAYAVSRDRAWFVNDADQCVYALDAGIPPARLTRPSQSRFADIIPDLARNRLIAVRERHQAGRAPANTLVAIDLASGRIETLRRGHDFFASPRLSRDGHRLAWLDWNHPNMPWNQTALRVAELDLAGRPRKPRRIAAGTGTSVFQPEFAPDGALYFMADATGWWNLWRFDGEGVRQVVEAPIELGLPQWQLGMRSWAVLDSRTALCAGARDGGWRLYRVDLTAGALEPVPLPFTHFEHVAAAGPLAVLLAAAADRATAVIRLDMRRGHATVVRSAQAAALAPDAISRPLALEFETAAGAKAHAWHYPPLSAACVPAPGERPPLRVICHGGPTGAASTGLDLRIQFWTSRGWAVLDVDYRGSTGYGRAYREQLYGRWGEADVEDCAYAARHAIRDGLADASRLVISGSSAGGYTVLCALAFTDTFSAGAVYYGVADPESLFAGTHKFESRYDHWLFGPEPLRTQRMRARSPLLEASRIRCPVIFFQGLDDTVVPPAQTRRMAAALEAGGVPVEVVTFAGEAHGFRGAAAIRRALESELGFYARVLGLPPAGE
ncbi:MAG TPA: prolyl oligopeptidase family serine peptidase [Gammaproteobacteria bacterium]|nr:prolyl oligopeptidase family serine peptidase [Gammaproteobacteria bacterium]